MASAGPFYGKLGASFRMGGNRRIVGGLRWEGRPELRDPVTRSARQCTEFGRSGPTLQDLRYVRDVLSEAASRAVASRMRRP